LLVRFCLSSRASCLRRRGISFLIQGGPEPRSLTFVRDDRNKCLSMTKNSARDGKPGHLFACPALLVIPRSGLRRRGISFLIQGGPEPRSLALLGMTNQARDPSPPGTRSAMKLPQDDKKSIQENKIIRFPSAPTAWNTLRTGVPIPWRRRCAPPPYRGRRGRRGAPGPPWPSGGGVPRR